MYLDFQLQDAYFWKREFRVCQIFLQYNFLRKQTFVCAVS